MVKKFCDQHERNMFTGIFLLLLLRFPLLYAASAFENFYVIGYLVYMGGTYAITGVVLYQNRQTLYKYNITWPALFLFLGTPLIAVVSEQYYSDPTVWLKLVLAGIFAVLFYRQRRTVQMQQGKRKSILPNIIITAGLCVVVPIAIHAIEGFPSVPGADMSLRYDLPDNLIFQLSTAAISEEPLFRGFIMGFLVSKGLRSWQACAVQALLFWIGHIYYIDTGINFWIIHPLVALLLGLLVWKTKSITHSMALHTCINTFSDFLRVVHIF